MSVSRRAVFGRMNALLVESLESATALARSRGNPYVELTHWLHQLLDRSDSDMHRLLRADGVDVELLLGDIGAAMARLPSGAGAAIDFSHQLEAAAERSWVVASLQFGLTRVRGAALLEAVTQTPELRRSLLAISPRFGRVDVAARMAQLGDLLRGCAEGADLPGQLAVEGAGWAGDETLAGARLDDGGEGDLHSAASEPASALERYCVDLTARAHAGSPDPVLGRTQELHTMVDILLRRRQNNPLLTGEAGVGKTAVAESLALAIARGDVPTALRDARLLALDVGAMLAGASARGEFESRLKRLLDEATRSSRPVILFIDEVHTLVGAGGQAGTGDAANLLKPALARGALRVIGATTWAEFKRHIEKDPALTRRFQVLQIAEPAVAEAVVMVRGLVDRFAAHHGVVVLDGAVRAAVTLSHRYIPARQLPDKAISLLDTACARAALSLDMPPARVDYLRQARAALLTEIALLEAGHLAQAGESSAANIAAGVRLIETDVALSGAEARWREQLECVRQVLQCRESADPAALRLAIAALKLAQADAPWVHGHVDEALIASVVEDWTGIPVRRLVSDDVDAAVALEARLGLRVVGQHRALALLAGRVRASRAGLTDPGKPVGVFLLAGPSGTGKTETALALAEALHGTDGHLITINMSEYQEAHAVSSLKGSPPGYVGYGEGGTLTEAVRRKPYSVVLLDEIEKAHPDVHEVFYQVFDKGWMEDGEGRVIDFTNTLILLTSNVGAREIAAVCALGGDAAAVNADPQAARSDGSAEVGDIDIDIDSNIAEALHEALANVFPAAFLGRLVAVPYRPLTTDALIDIAALQLARLAHRMHEQHDVRLVWDESVVLRIVDASGAADSGARRMGRFIEEHIVPPLADLWLDAMKRRARPDAVRIACNAQSIADASPARGRIAQPFSFNPEPISERTPE